MNVYVIIGEKGGRDNVHRTWVEKIFFGPASQRVAETELQRLNEASQTERLLLARKKRAQIFEITKKPHPMSEEELANEIGNEVPHYEIQEHKAFLVNNPLPVMEFQK